jgi:hypothetical protein
MKKIFFLYFACCLSMTVFGQDKPEKVIKMTPTDSIVPKVKNEQPPLPQVENRRIAGGTFFLTFWGDRLLAEVSPQFLYKINTRTHIGLGSTVGYLRATVNGGVYEHNYYALRGILRFMLFENIYIHGEYEMINGFKYNPISPLIQRDWMPSLLIGATYRSQMSHHTFSTLSVFYNPLYGSSGLKIVYGSPLVIRVGFEYEW